MEIGRLWDLWDTSGTSSVPVEPADVLDFALCERYRNAVKIRMITRVTGMTTAKIICPRMLVALLLRRLTVEELLEELSGPGSGNVLFGGGFTTCLSSRGAADTDRSIEATYNDIGVRISKTEN
jgi:hypothetical protein